MADMFSELSSMAGQLAEVQQQLARVREVEKALKAREEELRRNILLGMGTAKSLNLEGVGRLVRRDKTRYEIRNIEALSLAMLMRMVDNGKNGRPLADGLLLQQRVAARNLEEVLSMQGLDPEQEEAYIQRAGLAKVVEPALTFTKA